MKAVRIIYIIMNSIMIAACIALAILKTQSPYFALYLIAPILTAGAFIAALIVKSKSDFKKLMTIILSAHISVVITVAQGVFVFDMQAGNAAVIIAITAALMVFMIWSMRKMFKKLDNFASPEAK
jgi:hypothetical protein